MNFRLFTFIAASLFSISVYANQMVTQAPPADTMKDLVACGEVSAAQHIVLFVPLAITAAFDKSIEEGLMAYQTKMSEGKSCPDFEAAYSILAEVARQNGVDPEAYFSSPEGKQALEATIAELRKLK